MMDAPERQLRFDRLIPLPSGTHRSVAKPLILPGENGDARGLPAPSKRSKKAKPIEKRNAIDAFG